MKGFIHARSKIFALMLLLSFLIVGLQHAQASAAVKAKVEVSKVKQCIPVAHLEKDVFINDAIVLELKPFATVESLHVQGVRIKGFNSHSLPVANSPPDKRC